MNLENLRKNIDDIDARLVMLIGERLRVANQIGNEKKKRNIPVDDQSREAEVIDHVCTVAQGEGIDVEVVRKIYTLIIAGSKKVQGI